MTASPKGRRAHADLLYDLRLYLGASFGRVMDLLEVLGAGLNASQVQNLPDWNAGPGGAVFKEPRAGQNRGSGDFRQAAQSSS